jgi:hypothetical protein
MRESTIHRPALLGIPGAYRREASRIVASAAQPDLFDGPVTLDGVDGNTRTEVQAVRAFCRVGEAFGLRAAALAEWHAMFDRGAAPHPAGALARECLDALPDLLLRCRTLAQFQDREGKGGAYAEVWKRSSSLRQLLALRSRLNRDVGNGLQVEQDGSATVFTMLGSVRLRVDVHLRVFDFDWVPPAEHEAPWRRPPIRLTGPGTWVAGWLARRQAGCPIKTEHGEAAACSWLLAEAGVADELDSWLAIMKAHPSWPQAAVQLTAATFGKFAPCYSAARVQTVWRHAGLYRELAEHALALVPLMPAIHERCEPRVADFGGLRDLRRTGSIVDSRRQGGAG